MSIGGRLSKLLQADFRLETQDRDGALVRVNTAVLRRGGDAGSDGAQPAQAPPRTLWLCDWKDQASAWYALSECALIVQCTKATDSKTVAMWLVEVAPDDAVIISLQSGLHNVRLLAGSRAHALTRPRESDRYESCARCLATRPRWRARTCRWWPSRATTGGATAR